MREKIIITPVIILIVISSCGQLNIKERKQEKDTERAYNTVYQGAYLNRVAFPIGGIGAGMFCLEGTGAVSHMSVNNHPDMFNEPLMFAAISVKGIENGTKVLEGPVPDWKKYGQPGCATGMGNSSYGFPRFENATFMARFPFGKVTLKDRDIPLDVHITGWSPFIPADADNSSLPVGALEYTFKNTGSETIEAVFSYSSGNFMAPRFNGFIDKTPNGFVLSYEADEENQHLSGDFGIFTQDSSAVVDYCWFRGKWNDSKTVLWKTIEKRELKNTEPVEKGAPGASLFIPLTLQPGQSKTIPLLFAWYVPDTNLRFGDDLKQNSYEKHDRTNNPSTPNYHKPWYSARFSDIDELIEYWKNNYNELRENSVLFKESFYKSTLPAEIIEAIAANLTILKSPTILRQTDGRLWAFEGCGDIKGSGYGTCTHVWNYAQAIPHLFPSLERTLRNTDFNERQNSEGLQTFRAGLPVRPVKTFKDRAAADGQLGSIMNMYREWRVSGNTDWLRSLWPKIKLSLDYCINTYDPERKGILEEPHHNTYDIEYWGPEGHCGSIYLGALLATVEMGTSLGKDVFLYRELITKGKYFLENDLYNGEYFIQKIQWRGLQASDPLKWAQLNPNVEYSEEAIELFKKEGPKYQYGNGCLSDGILGCWFAEMCGLPSFIDEEKVKSHLLSVYKYNFKKSLFDHVNPQRSTYACGNEGGLLLCSWPEGGELTLPFVYSNEVWTGIEYQVASHLILCGEVEKGLEIVRQTRKRYDGRVRNPFNEYEYGNWYARAMSSYGLIYALTGVRYDAVDKILYINSKIGDFQSFLSTNIGFGIAGLKKGQPFVEMRYGSLDVKKVIVSGKEMELL